MDQYFDPNYAGGSFQLFGPPHLAVLGLVLLVNLGFVLWGKKIRPSTRRRIRYVLAGLLVANEIGWHTWVWITDQWSVQSMLPLHLSGLLIWLSAAMLLTRNYTLYEFVYFLGIGGSLQTLLTPTLNRYGFPHYRFLEIFLSHATVLTSAVYMTTVEGLRPRWRSILKVIIGTNIFMLLVGFVNKFLGSNYLYIANKPATPSLLDYLGPWPWYIVGMEAAGLVTILILYLPFAIRDWRAQKRGK